MTARYVGAAFLAGCLFAGAAPPTNLYPALWLGMAWLAYLLEEARKPTGKRADAGRPWSLRRACALGVAFGTGANLVALRFVPGVIARFTTLPSGVGWLALVLLAIEQSGRWGAAAIAHWLLVRRGVPPPWAFATGVVLGTLVPAVFPWSPAGGVTPVPALVQLAEVVGERGVTFVMALAAGALASAGTMLRSGRTAPGLRAIALAAGLPLATFLGGAARMRAVESAREAAPTTRVAIVQPSTDARDRWNPDRAQAILAALTAATARGEHDGAELTVWPEAAYPYVVAHGTRRCPIGAAALLPYGVRGPVLSGLVMAGGAGDVWNSAAVCRTDGVLGPPQDKIHLLWFGETIPWLDRIPAVRQKFTRGIGLVAGTDIVLQRAGRIRASVLNCFEDTLPDAGRDAMAPRPNLLVNVTNDAWFQGSAESELHLRLAVLRAVESRRDLVRAVNGGLTSWVDAAGVVRDRADPRAPSVTIASVALLEGPPTPFDRFGDVPLGLLLGLGSLAFARRSGRPGRASVCRAVVNPS